MHAGKIEITLQLTVLVSIAKLYFNRQSKSWTEYIYFDIHMIATCKSVSTTLGKS